MSDEIREALSPSEIMACWPTIKELRPHLIESEVLGRIRQQQNEEGYRLMYISDEENHPVAIMGFRIQHYLWSGKTLYIDDLCTLSSVHRKGHAGKLLDWATQHAVEQKCDALSLDSGYTRHNAHRLYLNKGFVLESHHFFKALK